MQGNLIEHWKYSYDNDKTFKNGSIFGIKYPIRSWYAVKQINQTKPNQTIFLTMRGRYLRYKKVGYLEDGLTGSYLLLANMHDDCCQLWRKMMFCWKFALCNGILSSLCLLYI